MTSLEATLRNIVAEAERVVRLSDLPRSREIEKARKRLGDFDAVVSELSDKRPLRRICEQKVWTMGTRLGAGAHGVVAQACNVETRSCAYAVKSFWQHFDSHTGKPHYYEVLLSTLAGDLSVGPFVHDAWTCTMTADELMSKERGKLLSPLAQPYLWTQLGKQELGMRLVAGTKVLAPETAQGSGSVAPTQDTKWYIETVRVADAVKTAAGEELRETLREENPSGVSITLMVMEQINGVPLLRWATKSNPSAREIEDVLNALIKAVDKLHKVGIVHRDLHIGNVMVVRSAGGLMQTRIVDYGRARMVGKDDDDDKKSFARDWEVLTASMERHLNVRNGHAVYVKWRALTKDRLAPRSKTDTYTSAIAPSASQNKTHPFAASTPVVIRSQSPRDTIQAAVALDDRVVFVMREKWSDSLRQQALRLVQGLVGFF